MQPKTQTELSPEKRAKIISHATAVGVWGNILLSTYKLVAGILGHSGAMLSDAIHSFSDVLATFVAWIGVRMAEAEADRDHPYGHERFECVASIILAIILFTTAFGIGYGQLVKIFSQESRPQEPPGGIALVAAIVSIIVKELMYHYTKHCAKRLRSSAFLADAWHHRSDAISSIGSLIGIAGARMSLPILDPIAGFIISLFILKVAISVFRDAVSKIVDKSCSKEFEEELTACILEEPGVIDVDILRTRSFGERIYVDAEIGIDGARSLSDAHRIAENVHDRIEREYPDIKHIFIHENPHD